MLDKLGTKGVAGVVSLFLGIGVAAFQAPVIAAGLVFVIAGLGLVADGFAEDVMRTLGMT